MSCVKWSGGFCVYRTVRRDSGIWERLASLGLARLVRRSVVTYIGLTPHSRTLDGENQTNLEASTIIHLSIYLR